VPGKGWNAAGNLKVGEALRLQNGITVVIKKVDTSVRTETVYNFTVANYHNYFVGRDGVLVHNTGKFAEPILPGKIIVREGGVTVEHYTHGNEHPPAHAHVRGEGPTTRIGANGKPLEGDPELSTTQNRVVKRNSSIIRRDINKIRRWWKYKYHLCDK